MVALVLSGALFPATVSAADLSLPIATETTSPTNETPSTGDEFSCASFTGFFSANILNCAIAGIGNLMVWGAGKILNLSADILNFSVDLSVVRFNELEKIPGVYIAWKVGRDLANMFFIFILLYVAIGQILQLPSVAGKGLIVNIVLVAIFINFSLVLSRIVIDASNVVASEFNNAILGGPSRPNEGIGDILLARLGPISAINQSVDQSTLSGTIQDAPPPLDASSFTFVGVVFGSLGGTAVMLIASFVLIAASIMLVIRAVILILLMILAPLAFLTSILPKHSQLGRWWETLLNQSIFAPAYLFMTYAAFKVIESANFYQGSGAASRASGVIGGIDQVPGFVIYFAILIILLLSALVIAKELAGRTANFATGATQTIFGTAGRGTAGRLATYLGEKLDTAGVAVGQTRAGRAVMTALNVTGAAGATRGILNYAATSKYGTGASYEDVVKKQEDTIKKNAKARANDPVALSRYISSLGRIAGAGPSDEQKVAYESLSPRNRAAYELEADKPHEAEFDREKLAGETSAQYEQRTGRRAPSKALRESLSIEEQEKTGKEYGQARFKASTKAFEDLIDDNGNLTQDTPENRTALQKYADQITGEFGKNVSKINDLKAKALLNDLIVSSLSIKHLKSVSEKNELGETAIRALVNKIQDSTNSALRNYINNPKNSEYWTGAVPPAVSATTTPQPTLVNPATGRPFGTP